jgi:hypothetical protein
MRQRFVARDSGGRRVNCAPMVGLFIRRQSNQGNSSAASAVFNVCDNNSDIVSRLKNSDSFVGISRGNDPVTGISQNLA